MEFTRIFITVIANVAIIIPNVKANTIQSALKAFIPVFAVVAHKLCGRNVFLSHSYTPVSFVIFKTWKNTCLW